MSDLKTRKGRLIITAQILAEPGENSNLLETLFSEFIPVNIEPYFAGGYWDDKIYSGYSKHFESLEEGMEAPVYSVIIKTDKDKITSIEFTR
jgi:hypothetical protein